MLQTIIVGIDGRHQDAEALSLARQLGGEGAELVAASVGVYDPLAPSFESRTDAHDAAERTVDAFVEALPGVEGLARTAPSVGLGLAELARGARADLIVVASSRRGLLGRVFAGDSVADVLRHAPCPVAVAPVGYEGKRKLEALLVGYDGSLEADGALRHAAERDGGRVSVVEVVEPFVAVTALGVGDDRELAQAYDRAQTNLDRLATEYGLHGVIATGRATHELAEASRAADLLCVGLHHHGLLDRLLVGSTVHALLREQAAPMLIVPPEPEPAQAAAPAVADALDPAPAKS